MYFGYHVHMAVESFDPAEQLLVVSAVDQHLRVALHALREHGQRARRELLLLRLRLVILLGSTQAAESTGKGGRKGEARAVVRRSALGRGVKAFGWG